VNRHRHAAPEDDAGSGALRRQAPLLAAAAVMLVVGILIGRATAGAAPAQEEPPEPAATANAQDALDGPSRTERGVAVGFPRTMEGAVAAAAEYIGALDAGRGLVPAERAAVLDTIAADGQHEQLEARMAAGLDILVENFGLTPDVVGDPDFVARTIPAGYQISAYDGAEATVRLWSTSVFFAAGRHASSGDWSTETVTLRWDRDDWRLVALESEPGPAPPDTPTPPVPGAGERINAFQRFVHVTPPR
jgi:hypothetical protein